MCRDTDCLLCGRYGPLRVFFQVSCSWRSEGLFGQSFSAAPPVQALRGLPCLESFSVVWHIRNIEGYPWLGSYSVDQACQALKGALWVVFYSVVRCLMSQPLYCSAANAGMWGERGYGDGSTASCDSAVSPCFMAAWLSSTGIAYCSLLPHIPSISLSSGKSSACLGIAPQSPNSSSQPLHLLGDLCPCPGYE